MVEFFERRQEMAGRAGEAVELPDQDTIKFAVAGAGHQGVELGAPFAAAGNGDVAIFADDGETGALGVSTQAVILQVWLLVGRGDAQVEGRMVLLWRGCRAAGVL
ncbi:hypothetical protein ABIA16_000356 [Sinorhizobium fredii]